MPYRLNPVRAVKKLGYSKRDIIGPSDKCFTICAAYSSRDNAYKIERECEKQCEEFVEERRNEVYGVGRCDHQAPYRPVIWDNIPHYVPLFLAKGKSPEEALEMSKKMCAKVPNLYNECVDMCNLDYDAIETYDNVKTEGSRPKTEVYDKEKRRENDKVMLMATVLGGVVLLSGIIYFMNLKAV